MRASLTDLTIQSLKAETQMRVFDTQLKGFGILVSKTTKTFFVVQGKERKLTTIGRYPATTLRDARQQARKLQVTPTSETTGKTFLDARTAFGEAIEGKVKPDTRKQYLSYLNQMSFTKDVSDITYADVLEAIELWKTKPHAQNYAYASIRVFLGWCLEREYIDRHPLYRKKPPNKVRTRDRVLSDEELARVWRCTADNTYGKIMRLLILTGQRRIEVRNLKPEDVQDGLITFHTKGGKTNVIPLTPLMSNDLKLPFKFNDWSGSKARFDNDCGVDFRHHDLRRTLSTKLAMLGVNAVVIERILGHAIPGVAGVYNRYSYIPEIKEALLTFEAHLRKITGMTDPNRPQFTEPPTDFPPEVFKAIEQLVISTLTEMHKRTGETLPKLPVFHQMVEDDIARLIEIHRAQGMDWEKTKARYLSTRLS